MLRLLSPIRQARLRHPSILLSSSESCSRPLNPLSLSVRHKFNLLKNEKIPHKTVSVVNRETNKPEPPVSLESLLETLDRRAGWFYMLVAETPVPLVKLMNKKEEKEKTKKAKPPETKIFEMTWLTDVGDLHHKLGRVKLQFKAGNNVQVVLTPKRKSPLPPPETQEERVSHILHELEEYGEKVKLERRGPSVTILFRPKK